MQIEIKIPSVGESVQEAVLVQWYKQDGELVQKDEPLFLIETDKITLEVAAEATGVLKIKTAEGQTVAIGSVVGILETDGEAHISAKAAPPKEKEIVAKASPSKMEKSPTGPKKEAPPAAIQPPQAEEQFPARSAESPLVLSPSVRRLVAEKNLDIGMISGTGPGGRITKGDVLLFLEQTETGSAIKPSGASGGKQLETPPAIPALSVQVSGQDPISRKPMSPIRRRIAARLLQARQNTAMLTTFNEIDMSRVMAVRSQRKESFKKKHGVSLGFMSFFIKATVKALKDFPEINASIEAQDIIYHHYYHIGVAIGTERGLIVPVIRDADQLSFAELEQRIVDFVGKIKENRLDLADLEGGTFTISNGGVYGSLLSTPILNMPQSGILGMHKIENRPVALNDQVVVHPMMYVALSYDHRIVDGREAVTFLKRIKEHIEKPEEIMMEM